MIVHGKPLPYIKSKSEYKRLILDTPYSRITKTSNLQTPVDYGQISSTVARQHGVQRMGGLGNTGDVYDHEVGRDTEHLGELETGTPTHFMYTVASIAVAIFLGTMLTAQGKRLF